MEPIPETVEAIRNLGPFLVEDEDLLAELGAKVDQVVAVVPQCVGVSLASFRDGVAFTLVASAAEIAVLDAVQYVAGGPCVASVEADDVVQYEPVLGEAQWQLFSRATAAMAVASTLTLPVLDGDQVVGSVNLYAATPQAFTAHHDQVAAIFGAWAPGAVTNADLAFATRLAAERAPAQLREDLDVAVAIGMIAASEALDYAAAGDTLADAARRAGVSQAALAMTIIDLERLEGSG